MKAYCDDCGILESEDISVDVRTDFEGTDSPVLCDDCYFKWKEKAMKTREEIESMLEKLNKAKLEDHVLDEIEYGKFWLKWVLGKEKDPDESY